MMSTIAHLPASSQRLESYKTAQSEDPICQQIFKYCETEWSDRSLLAPHLREYSPEVVDNREWTPNVWTENSNA